MNTHCVICEQRLVPNRDILRDHVDVCGKRCYTQLIERQRATIASLYTRERHPLDYLDYCECCDRAMPRGRDAHRCPDDPRDAYSLDDPKRYMV